MTKKEKIRRNRISRSLKRYHEQKLLKLLDEQLEEELILNELNYELDKNITENEIERKLKTSSNAWTKSKVSKKIKSFPKKDEPSKFFYATKRKYRLKKPIKVISEEKLNSVDRITKKIKKDVVKDLKKYNKEANPINLGYRIKMTFTSNDKNVKPTVIDTTSYRDAFIASSVNDMNKGFDLLKDVMLDAFKEYVTTSGFSELTFYGLESEIQE